MEIPGILLAAILIFSLTNAGKEFLRLNRLRNMLLFSFIVILYLSIGLMIEKGMLSVYSRIWLAGIFAGLLLDVCFLKSRYARMIRENMFYQTSWKNPKLLIPIISGILIFICLGIYINNTPYNILSLLFGIAVGGIFMFLFRVFEIEKKYGAIYIK